MTLWGPSAPLWIGARKQLLPLPSGLPGEREVGRRQKKDAGPRPRARYYEKKKAALSNNAAWWNKAAFPPTDFVEISIFSYTAKILTLDKVHSEDTVLKFRLVVLSLLRSRQVPDGLRCSASYVTQRCLRRRPTGYRQTITAFVDDHRHTLYVTLFFQPRYTLTLMMKRLPATSNITARQ